MQRRRLAAELHRLRTNARRTLEEVAEHLECSPAKISRIENNQVAVRIQDARDLLDLYGVEGPHREELLQVVREARKKGWWSRYSDLMEEGTETILSLEDEAASILIYENSLVNALLQTPDYARACLLSRTDAKLDVIQRQVELRMTRQRILTDPDGPALTVVLDEAALRRSVGDPTVMREQFRRLLTDADRQNTTVLVLPFSAGPHQAMGFPFCIFGFNGEDPRIVYVEMLERGHLIESAKDVGRYTAAFEQVQARALNATESVHFIEKLMDS
ncbi:helix-turn-helix domain-containing protein [Acrocarpospora catenulata]|uniref:helix-turn-helix domain-containing protein n=1 Tax=Acrocarpospora catenulata TaxID=2836182 RepID=UPI001BD9B7BB|nr:helix-turn-helix transcriptional regulator [Acrocarpospora catenulata]